MPPLELELAEKLALLVALTLFLGFAFEQIQKRDEPAIQGGIRTFPLVGLAGALLYLVEPQRAWHLPRAFFAIAAWLYASFAARSRRRPAGR